MKPTRKRAKQFIKNATLTEYTVTVKEAFLTVRQKRILLMKRVDEQINNWEIAVKMNLSVDTVNHELLAAYDRIAKVI